MKLNKKPIVLAILDGYGLGAHDSGDAIFHAKAPTMNMLWNQYPHIRMNASGKFVGLPDDQMGNSEVGHLNIGAGRIIYTGLSLINKSIEDGDFYKEKVLIQAIENAKKNNSNIHIMGLLSDGGVHSHIEHIFALLKLCKDHNFKNVFLHMFGDGRDVPPQSIKKYLHELDNQMQMNVGKLASLSGRYYAMDRDTRWDRVQKAYDVIVNNQGPSFDTWEKYIDDEYANKITDEFIVPAFNKHFDSKVKEHDSIIFANYRPDRAREISHMFIGSKIYNHPVDNRIKNLFFCSLCQYDGIDCPVVFPPTFPKHILGEVIENNGLTQLRIAETEKYAHVTFFFDGGREIHWPHGKNILVPSPKVATYDLKPEMSAFEITDKLIPELDKFDFVILNFANADMIGHTGKYPAAIAAIEAVDQCVTKILEKVESLNGTLFITADHGNAEQMILNGAVSTQHSTNQVPFICSDKSVHFANTKEAKLADIAPTILGYCGINVPEEMTGKNLFE